VTSAPHDMLVLAGGAGTRLRSVVNAVPKPMAPVAGRPFLEYVFDYWIDQGVRRFVLSLGYMGELIKRHFGASYRSAEVYCVEEPCPLGTGGAIRLALQEFEWSGRHVLVANGDTWFEVGLISLCHDACKSGMPVTIALKGMEINDRYGGVSVDGNGLVTAFGVNVKKNCLINAGYYLLDVEVVSGLLRKYPAKFSFEDDFLNVLAEKKQIASSIQDNIFLDIGVPSDYHKAAGVVRSYQFKGPIV